MPNLQSMSQAKGYGRLHKKLSQNELFCSYEIDRKSYVGYANSYFNTSL